MAKWKIKNFTKNKETTWFSEKDAKRIKELIGVYCFNHDLNLWTDCPELVEIINMLES